MAIRTVLTIPDPRLRLKAQPVASVDNEIQELMRDMLETLYAKEGVGLAAIQIGVQKRVIVLDWGREVHPHPLQMANPEILWRSSDLEDFQEGCLSIPEQYGVVKRPRAIKVKYVDEHNKSQELDLEGDLADCVQHEVEHLDGILYTDHLSPIKRKLILSKAQKVIKQQSRTVQRDDKSA